MTESASVIHVDFRAPGRSPAASVLHDMPATQSLGYHIVALRHSTQQLASHVAVMRESAAGLVVSTRELRQGAEVMSTIMLDLAESLKSVDLVGFAARMRAGAAA
jgi:hypothetical protein